MLSAARPFGAATRTPATATAAAGRSSSSLLVCRAKPTRASDFRGLDNAELLAKVDELKREKMRLQYMQKTRGNILNPGSENNPEAVQVQGHEFGHVRRQIAQLLTVLRERELADNITRKQSRALRKEVAVAAGVGRL